MSKHVFVSHSHKDHAVAESIVAALERREIPCWIAPRDVVPGGSYAESILTAIENASCFVLIYSANSNVSGHVLREVERALKFGVNIVPVRLDDSAPSKSLDYLLATVHWLSISNEAREQSIAQAAERIAGWLTNFLQNPVAPLPTRPSTVAPALVTSLEPRRKRPSLLAAAAVLVGVCAAAAYATGRLPFPRHAEQARAEVASPTALKLTATPDAPLKPVRPVASAPVTPARQPVVAAQPAQPAAPAPDSRGQFAMHPPPPHLAHGMRPGGPPPPPPGGHMPGGGMPPGPRGPRP